MTTSNDRENRPISRLPASRWNPYTAIPAIIYIVAVFVFMKNHYSVLDFPLDDAWIHRVYARSFAFGHGLAFNVGQQEAGSTSPLWAIVTAPAHWFWIMGTDFVVSAVKVITVMLGLVCVLTTQRIASRLIGSQVGGTIAASLYALDPKFLFSTLSGMETVLLVAVLVGACLMLMEKRLLFFLLLIGLAPVVRPEALVVLPCSLVGISLIWRTDTRVWLKTIAGFIPILPILMWIGFCLYATGHLLPNTFYLKAHPFSLGVPELLVGLSAMTQNGLVSVWLFPIGIVVFCFLCLKRRMSAVPPFLILIGVPLVYTLGVVGSRIVFLEGYYWTRWIDPASLLITAAFCIGSGFVISSAMNGTKGISGMFAPDRPSMIRITASLVGLVFLLISIPTFGHSFTNRRNQLASDSRAIAIMNVQMGTWIDENTAKDAVVGVNDAGAIRYLGRRHTIDLPGLNNSDIAFGKMTIQEAIAGADWLAIFPQFFKEAGLLDGILNDFEPRVVITIPLEEYTIANSPGQTQAVAFQRKSSRE